MLGLLFLVSLSTALDPTPADINKVCFKCNVYSAAGKMKCENPGVCYANFCYSYVTSDGTTMFLSGCAEDVSDFPQSGMSAGLHCQSNNGVALCICSTGKNACNYPEQAEGVDRKIYWTEREEPDIDNISTKVTGFSIDYALKRLDHLRQDGIDRVPMHFNVSRKINSAGQAVLGVMTATAPPPYEEKARPPEEGEPSSAALQQASVHPSPSVHQQSAPAQPTVILQPAQPQFVTVTQPANVVVVQGVKEAPCYDSYLECCPYCNQTVKTVVRYEWGTQTWIFCIISLIICWPLICAICCDCSKDAHHYCPCCSKLLAVKRR